MPAGVQPSALRMPIRRVAAPTVPATTVPTTSSAITMPSSANATRNGTKTAASSTACCRTSSQDRAPVTAPAGSAETTASRPVPTSVAVRASANR